MSFTEKNMAKPLIAGTILAATATALFGGGSIDVYGVNMPVIVPLFGAGVAGSYGAEFAHDYVLPNLPKSDKLLNMETAAVGALGSAAAAAGVLYFGAGLPQSSLPQIVGLSAGSFIASEYIVDNLLSGGDGELIF